jgi:protocatechuate 3,4-dioxygenase beta subunit
MRLTAVARFTIRVAGPAIVACATATAVAGPLSAQGIRGRVTEENTGPPLAGVAVSLHDNEQARVAGMTTGEAGDYEFTQLKPGTYGFGSGSPVFNPPTPARSAWPRAWC